MSCPRCGGLSIDTQLPSGAWRCKTCRAASPNYEMPRPSPATTEQPAAYEPPADPAAESAVDPPDSPPDAPDTPDTVAERPPTETHPPESGDELADALRAYAAEHGHSPTFKTWKRDRPPGAPSVKRYLARHGTWRAALIAAGLPPNSTGRRAGATPPLATRCSPPRPTPPRPEPSRTDDLLDHVLATPATLAVDRLPALHAMHPDVDELLEQLRRRYLEHLLVILDDAADADLDRIERALTRSLESAT